MNSEGDNTDFGVSGAQAGNGPDWLSHELIDLSNARTGLSFIYAALELIASRYELNDVVLVLETEHVGRQMFRLGGRAVSKEFVAQLNVKPGVYCEPRVVGAEDLETVWLSCQRALLAQQLRLDLPPRQDPGTRDLEMTRANPTRLGHIAESEADHEDDEFWSHPRRRWSPQRVRTGLTESLIIVDAVTLALTLASIHGPARFIFGLVFGVLIPGWSVVGLLNINEAALELGLSVAVSLAFELVMAQVLITLGLWHLAIFEDVICVVCLPLLFWQRGWRPRHRQQA